jgi:uncharacterized protein (DUF58 family)
VWVAPLAAVVGLVGAAWGIEELVLVAVAGAALLVIASVSLSWRVWWGGRRVLVSVGRPPGEVLAHSACTVVLTVTNVGTRGVAGVAVDASPAWALSHPGTGKVAGDPGASTRRHPLRRRPRRPVAAGAPGGWLAPGRSLQVGTAVPTQRRGLLSLEEAYLWWSDPLGLVRRRTAVAMSLHVLVYPAPVLPRRAAPLEPAPDVEGPALSSAVYAQDAGYEFAGLRSYVAGDRLSLLHWPALAAGGPLLVRAFVEPPGSRLRLPVDTRAEEIDRSVAVVAGLALAALAEGRGVAVWARGRERLTLDPGPGTRDALLGFLAVLPPDPVVPA